MLFRLLGRRRRRLPLIVRLPARIVLVLIRRLRLLALVVTVLLVLTMWGNWGKLKATMHLSSPTVATQVSIARIASDQLNHTETDFAFKRPEYGPCEGWSALFVTWVWQRDGIDIPSYRCSSSIYTWAVGHGLERSSQERPAAGWIALFGSGGGLYDSYNAAIVVDVKSDGEIVLINGNYGGIVAKVGPCPVDRNEVCNESHPIYGFVAPPGGR